MRLKLKRLLHQKKYIRSNAGTTALVTGYGGGKSKIGGARCVWNNYRNGGIPSLAVSPTYSMALKTVVPAITECLEKNFDPPLVDGKDFKYVGGAKSVFHIKPWNGIIYVGSADRPASLKGPNVGDLWIDEPGLCKIEGYQNAIARVRHPKAKVLQTGLTGTPEGLNWFYELCEKKPPKDFELIRGKTTDNTYLPQSYIDNLYDQYDAILVEAYINGMFVNMAGMSAYHTFRDNLDGNLTNKYEIDFRRPVYIGMDFNYDPMCSVLGQELIVEDCLIFVVFKEFYFRNCDTDAACEQIIDWCQQQYKGDIKYRVYPDPSYKGRASHGMGKTDKYLMDKAFAGKNYQALAPSQAPKRKDRLNTVNRLFCNANGIRRLFITEGCTHLRRDLTHITKEEFLNNNIKDDKLGHISDGLGYLISYRYPIRAKSGYIYNSELIV